MFLLHGHYKFLPRRAAVRAEWCTACRAPRVGVGTRSLAVLHLFWIPVLPVARATDWACAACGENPVVRLVTPRSRTRWLLAFAGFLAAVSLGLLVATLLTGRDPLASGASRRSDGLASAATFLVMAGIFAGVAIRRRRQAAEPGAVEARPAVAPLSGDACPLCGDLMLTRSNPRCPRCQVEILTS